MLGKDKYTLTRLQTEVVCALKKFTSTHERTFPCQSSPFLLAQMPVSVNSDLLVGGRIVVQKE